MKRAISFLIVLAAASGSRSANTYLLLQQMSADFPSLSPNYVITGGIGLIFTIGEGLALAMVWGISEDVHKKLWGGKP